jgi:hypothetical protein
MSTNILTMPLDAVSRPVPDKDRIRQALRLFMSLNPVVEIRGLEVTTPEYKKPHTEAGYFDDIEAAAKAAFAMGRADGTVYILLNPVNPALLARAKNRIKVSERGNNTSDGDVLRRCLLLVDCDPQRPAGISATDDEKEAARETALSIRKHLADLGWPEPVLADSGNGYHLLYRIDLPNDADSTALIKGSLEMLDGLFSDEGVKVDTAVHNAARIVKLYGTVARKGDHTSDRPHRTSALLEVPTEFKVVPRDLMVQLTSTLPSSERSAPPTDGAVDIERWAADHGLEVAETKPWNGGKLLVLACPFNSDHGETYHLAQFANGAISAGCLHRSCAENRWHALRDRFEAGWRDRPRWSNSEMQVHLAKIAEDTAAAFSGDFIRAGAILQVDDEPGWATLRDTLRKDKRLEWVRLKKKFEEAAKKLRAERQRSSTAGNQTESGLIVPPGYRLTDKSTIHITQDKDGAIHEAVIAYSPLKITARMRDVDENLEYLRIDYRRSGQPRSEVMERAVAMDSRKLIGMAATGFPVASDNVSEVVAYLHGFEATNAERLPASYVASRLGWQGPNGARGFLLGLTLVGADGTVHSPVSLEDVMAGDAGSTSVVFRGAAAGDEQIARSYRVSGSFDDWVTTVGLIQPFPKVQIAFYAGFVAPLQDILGVPNFIVNWSCDTSKGKTSSLRVAGSIYGNPDERADETVIGSWKATAVHIERACSIRSGLPMLLDETKHAQDRRDVAKVLYSVANGTGKGRGNTKGIALTRRFRTVMLSTGEAPATSFSQDGGTRTRCIEITGLPFGADDPRTGDIVNQVNSRLKQHYGHAGLRYIRWIIQNRERWARWKQEYRELADAYAMGKGSGAARVAEYVAAIVLAGRLAHEALGLPWQFRDPFTGALWEQITAEVDDAAGAERALLAVKSWADANREAFFGRHIKDFNSKPRVPTLGWAGRWDEGENWPWIAFHPHRLNEVLSDAGFEPAAILATWDQRRWLLLSGGRKHLARVRACDGVSWMVKIKRDAFEELDESGHTGHGVDTDSDTDIF